MVQNSGVSNMSEVEIQPNGTTSTSTEDNNHDHDRVVDPSSSDKDKERPSIGGSAVDGLNSSEYAETRLADDANALGNHSEGAEIGKSHQGGDSSSPHTTTPAGTGKGFGLKKWRRMRRENTRGVGVSVSSDVDSTKILKRGSANILDLKQSSGRDGDGDGDGDDGDDKVSVSSTNAFVQSLGGGDRFVVPESSPSCGLPVDATFSAGADSDNSDDRSSKSSTAASVPKFRYDALRASGHHREKHRGRNLSVKNLASAVGGHRSQASKSVDDSSKKQRGQKIKIDKETSVSSLESDSRSCSSVFFRGMPSVIGEQVQSGRTVNSDGEDALEELSVEELRAECSNNVSHSQDNLFDVNNGHSQNHQLPEDCDALVNSILMLQSAQVALEREVQKFGEIGKGIRSFCDDSSENTGEPALGPEPEVCKDRASNGWGSESNDVETLKRQLNEAEVKLKEKELRINELETTITTVGSGSLGEDRESSIELQQKRCKEMEAELESLFQQKLGAEVEYVAITTSTKDLSILLKDLLKAQKSLATEQVQSLRLMSDVENRAVKLQGQAEELDTLRKEIVGDEEIVKMQKRVVKFTKCLLIQLILLLLVLGFFGSQLLPKSAVVVPT